MTKSARAKREDARPVPPPAPIRVNVTEFKAKCLAMLTGIERSKRTIILTRNGRDLAIVTPADAGPESIHGCMKGTGFISDSTDTLLSTGEKWNMDG